MVPELEDEWYWDHRNRKAYRPKERREDTVVFETVWHEAEIEDALDTGVFEELSESRREGMDDLFSFIESFRLETDE
jgi:hypothetical protein